MKITIREDAVEVEGYVNAVGRDSRLLTDDDGYPFREQIEPGAFAKAIKAKEDAGIPIRMLLDHEREIGDTATNLQLEEDSIGLHAVAKITDAEVIQKARDRKLTGWSFGFIELDSQEEYTDSGRRRIVKELDLREVTLVDDMAIPAYAGTSVHTRTDGEPERIKTRTVGGEAIYTVAETEPAGGKLQKGNTTMQHNAMDILERRKECTRN